MSKVWLVTGAGSGIGAGIARAALRAGDRVIVTGRKLEKLRAAYQDIPQENVAFVELDISSEEKVQTGVKEAAARFGRIDVLVNNAGYSILGNFEETSVEDVEKQFQTNFFGVAHVMRAVLPIMRQQRSGQIFNISSVAGAAGLRHCSVYGASKFAVEGLSLAVAQEVGQFGINVTIVEPGFFRTNLLDPNNVRWAGKTLDAYAGEARPQDTWSPYNGAQPGDPSKLGDALVVLSQTKNPPTFFVAGSDALAVLTPAVDARLQAMKANERLSKSTDGS